MAKRTDTLSPEQRRKAMRAVKSKDSKIEVRLRKALWNRGHRYRKNYKRVFGKPDIVFVGLKIAIFCDSEFWHGHNWGERKHDFKSKKEYWINKIEKNMERDREVNQRLKEEGWVVLRFWGNAINKSLNECVERIESAIQQRQKEHIKRKS